MNKKILHFIAHTHWDREWYMSFENHRFRLVKLLDTLFETFEKDSDYKSFHLDGQVVLLEDYLEVRPEKLEIVRSYVESGRLKIGPNYILPDEFLTSGESNIRNLQIGMRECRKYGGDPTMIGYFPDAFGNISQAPQILKGFNIDTAYYGRGVASIGANNTVYNSIKTYQSEMIWRSPDGSDVVGVLFANWYHNAYEIPLENEEAINYIGIIKEKAMRFSSTPHLLMMNGCDHQPVQTNLPQILKNISAEFKDELIMSDLTTYAKEISKYKDLFDVVEGELNSKHSDGWWTLINTASTRIYLKQMNHKAQRDLTIYAEPISVFNMLYGGIYDKDILDLSWKTLLKNHPHDSICGCSIDDVHEEMVVRFKKTIDITNSITKDNIKRICSVIDTSFCNEGEIPLIVFNTSIKKTKGCFSTCLDFNTETEIDINNLNIIDMDGNSIPCSFENLGKVFNYELPDDSFRKIIYVNRVRATMETNEIPGMGYTTYRVVQKSNNCISHIDKSPLFAENSKVGIDFNIDGSFNITDKRSGKIFHNLNKFEDTGDVGDEYTYHQSIDNESMFSDDKAEIELLHSGLERIVYKVIYSMKIPISADIKTKTRKNEYETLKITSYITLWNDNDRIDIKTEFQNTMCDHRLRVLFPTDIISETVIADGQFDIIKREIQPWSEWENPCNAQRQQAFVTVKDDFGGLMIANKGLCEYEVLRDGINTIALTICRSVGRLGDWGEFPTPGAQCLGVNCVEYSVIPYQTENFFEACEKAYDFCYEPIFAVQTISRNGIYPSSKSFISLLKGEGIVFSALKKADFTDDVVLRIYNNTEICQDVELFVDEKFINANILNLKEDILSPIVIKSNRIILQIEKKKIITIGLVV